MNNAYYNLNEFSIDKIIGYLRRSRQDMDRERRTGEDTLLEQDMLMNKVLADIGIEYDIKKEIGSGDKIETRPIFQGVLKDLRDKKYDAVAVKEISRLGRGSYTDMGQIFDLIVDKRIYIITPYKIYDPQNPSDKRQIRFEIFLSREEFEMTRERLVGARYNYAMQGKWMAGSSIPFGYKLNKNTQRLEPHEDNAKVIKLMYELYVNGLNGKEMAFRAIATYLERMGIKTSQGLNRWSPRTIARMIINPVNIGQVRFRITQEINGKRETRPEKEWIIVNEAHEALVSEVMWYDANKKYIERGQASRTKLDFSPCELAGLIICEKCGHKMIRHYSVQNYTQKDGEVIQYHKEFLWCPTTGCSSVKYRAVEDVVLIFLEELKGFSKDKLRDILMSTIENKKEDEFDIDEFKQSIKDKEKELNLKLAFVHEKYESGIYSDEDFIKRRKKIQDELSELQRVIPPESVVNSKEKQIDIDVVFDKIDSVLNIYKSLDSNKSDKNSALKEVIDHMSLEILELGHGRTPAKFKLRVVLCTDYLV